MAAGMSPAFPARFVGTCWLCGGEIDLGDMVAFDGDEQVVHDDCL